VRFPSGLQQKPSLINRGGFFILCCRFDEVYPFLDDKSVPLEYSREAVIFNRKRNPVIRLKGFCLGYDFIIISLNCIGLALEIDSLLCSKTKDFLSSFNLK